MYNFVNENSYAPLPAQFQCGQFRLVQEIMICCIIISIHKAQGSFLYFFHPLDAGLPTEMSYNSSHCVVVCIIYKISFSDKTKHIVNENIKENGTQDRTLWYPLDDLSPLAPLISDPDPLLPPS